MSSDTALAQVPCCCPASRIALAPVDLTSERGRSLAARRGTLPAGTTGLLASADGEIVYPIIDGIPHLMEIDALGLPTRSGVGTNRLAEVEEEIRIYDGIAGKVRGMADAAGPFVCGEQLWTRLREKGPLGEFPEPAWLWLDAPDTADCQAAGYVHILPLRDMAFLQVGGAGSHVVRALLAGARIACLLSPSHEEILVARDVVVQLGLGDRFVGVRGIAEAIPIQGETFDRAYGGGTLHHTQIQRSIPEVARVLRAGGKASFVEPVRNVLYQAWRLVSGGVRFCGEEEGTLDAPVDLRAAREYASAVFSGVTPYLSGGPLRYLLVLGARVFGTELRVESSMQCLRFERRVLSFLRLSPLFNTMVLLLER